jgi:hypothetical protein
VDVSAEGVRGMRNCRWEIEMHNTTIEPMTTGKIGV